MIDNAKCFKESSISKRLLEIKVPDDIYSDICRLWLECVTIHMKMALLKNAVLDMTKDLNNLIEKEDLHD